MRCDMLHEDLAAVQCRAGRATLNWTQSELAEAARVSIRAIQDFESEKRSPNHATRAALRHAMEVAGVEFRQDDASFWVGRGMRGITRDPRKMGLEKEIEQDE